MKKTILVLSVLVLAASHGAASGSGDRASARHVSRRPAAAGVSYVRGDTNNDGQTTLADVIYLADYLFGRGPAPLPRADSGDVDCDSDVGVLDIVYLVDYLVRRGPSPGCPS